MHKIFKRFLASALLACFPLVFAACGGGGGESVEMTTISGTAVKGPIKGALVQVFKLNSNGTTGELLGSGISDGSAKYSIQIPKAKAVPPLLVTVSGQSGATYTSETTNAEVPFTAAEKFNAVLDTFDTTKSFTVSPLTDAAYQQVQKFLTETPAAIADTRIISAANARIATLFNVSDVLADPATDPSYSAALKIIDQMVVSSGTATTLQTMTLINQAFVDVESQAYLGFQADLVAAATAVVTADPSATAIINAIIATTVNPPAEPVLNDTTAPNAVINLTVATVAETAAASSATLSWKAATTAGSNSVAGYDVYRDGSKIASVTSTGYVDRPLTPSTNYKYYIVTFDAAGNRSVPSSEITVMTPVSPNLNVTVSGQLTSAILALPKIDIFVPYAPANLSATPAALDATFSSVSLSWSASTDNVDVTNTGISGYEIFRDGSKIGTATLPGYTDPSVTSNVTYVYFVKAVDGAGNRSGASSPVSIKPPPASLGVIVGGQVTP